MEIKYKQWKDITISKYYEIMDIYNNGEDIFEKEVSLIACLCDCEEDDIYNLSLPQVQQLIQEAQWTKEMEDYTKVKPFSKIEINGVKYDIITDCNKFTYSQYVDFQTFLQNKSSIDYILSTLIVPKGCKYNEGYDIMETINIIRENIDIVTANSIQFFFLQKLHSSIKRTLRYSMAQLKVMRMMRKITKEQKKKEMEKLKAMECFYTSVLSKK